jgi:tellurite resistance protein TerC
VTVAWWGWAALGGLVALLLLVDLLLFARGGTVSLRAAALWSVGWTLLGLAFAGVLLVWQGRTPAEEYLAGFIVEKSLSVDNLFVFALVFSALAIPPTAQRRVLFWGITGAVVLRAIFVFAGAAMLDAFHWTIYLFGGILVLTAIRMARHEEREIDLEQNRVLRALRRVVGLTPRYHGGRFLVREDGRLSATPLFAGLVLVAAFDVVFAIDSIPAIFAITRDTFVVLAANAFSLLGLSSLFFVLVGMLSRFRHLDTGLAIVLGFVGVKMLLSDVYHMPVWLSLAVIVGVIGATVALSLRPPRDGARRSLTPERS